jgi:hypothetical protein
VRREPLGHADVGQQRRQGAVGDDGGATQRPQAVRVQPAQRRGEQAGQELLGPGRVDGEPEQVQHVPDDGLLDQEPLPRPETMRDREPVQRPPHGAAEGAGGEQDGHAAVGHAVALVGEAEQAGDGLGLLGPAGRGDDLERGARARMAGGGGRTGPGRGVEAGQPPDRVQPGPAEAAAARQRDQAGAERLGVTGQRARGRAPERVGGPDRVPGQHDPHPGPGQEPEQAQLGGVQLLRLVDQDGARPGRGRPQDVGLGLEQVAGLGDQPGVVDGVVEGEPLLVDGEERRRPGPGRAVLGRGAGGQLVRAEQAALTGQQQLGQVVGEAAGADQRRERSPVDPAVGFEEKGADQRPLLGAVEGARLTAVAEQVGMPDDEGAGERVPGDGAEPAHGRARRRDQPLGRGLGGLAGGDEQEAGSGLGVGVQAQGERLEQGRLATARPAEHAEVAVGQLPGQVGRGQVGKHRGGHGGILIAPGDGRGPPARLWTTPARPIGNGRRGCGRRRAGVGGPA